MKFGRGTTALLLLLPGLAYGVFFFAPLLSSARISFNEFSRFEGMTPGFTLDHYRLALTDSYYLQTWASTLRLAFESATITTILGAVTAYGMWRAGGRVRTYLLAVVLAPLLVSAVVRALGWIAVLGPGGFLPHITSALGLGEVTIMFSEPAIVIGFVHVLLPFAVILTLTNLDAINPSAMRAAANLGATQLQVIRRVVLPLTYPGLFSSFLYVYAIAGAAYSIPAILGGRRVLAASRAIFQQQTAVLNRPSAAALSMILIVVTVTLMLIYQWLTRRMQRQALPWL
ncbi:MAG: ABC transporter permease [Ardenticatenaceae bacterium]|nr:ABC transporter permease [Ardenticatenaceae bacterium]